MELTFLDDIVTILPELVLAGPGAAGPDGRPVPAAPRQVAPHAAHRRRPAARRSRLLRGVGHQRDRVRRVLRRRRRLGLPQGHGNRHRHPERPVRAGVSHVATDPAGRVLDDPRQRDPRHVHPRLERRPHHRVPGPRANGDAVVPAHGPAQDRSLQQRGGAEVLPARQLRERDPPVHCGVGLRADRDDEHRRDRGRARRADERGHPGGARVRARRRHVQDRRGAVPLLDAGRLPGSADADHRVPLGRTEAGRLRAPHPGLRRGLRAAHRRLDRRLPVPHRADDDRRQHHRPDPGQREADARLLEHRAHRLHHGRPRGLRRRR